MSVLVYADPNLNVFAVVSVEILDMTPAQAEVHLARLLLGQANRFDSSDATCERILRWLHADPPDPATSGREMAAATFA